MITPETRAAVLRRDGYTCRIAADGCARLATQVAHVLFRDRTGKYASKTVRDWVDEEWNLTASCAYCNVIARADKTYEARVQHVERMMRLDLEGLMNWWFRRPLKIYDKEIDILINRIWNETQMRREENG